MIEATCHCQAVRFQIAHAPETVTSCNCSICRRLGALWAYYNPSEVTLVTPDAAIDGYVHGDRMLTLHHCRVCGCTTHWSPMDETHPRMGVNARLFEPEILAGAKVRRLDGADTWTYFDEDD
ncbi:MAG TPA: GFA family protein [Caulobacteraceae bacterium]|jgi:hypothetical protein